MSSLHPGDENLHYSDHSHRWIAPTEIEQEVWESELATHIEQHRSTMDRPLRPSQRGGCRRPTRPATTGRPVTAPAPILAPIPVGAGRR